MDKQLVQECIASTEGNTVAKDTYYSLIDIVYDCEEGLSAKLTVLVDLSDSQDIGLNGRRRQMFQKTRSPMFQCIIAYDRRRN